MTRSAAGAPADVGLRDPIPRVRATVGVVVPTRGRPDALERCLDALRGAREHVAFDVVVADSTPDPDVRALGAEVCARDPWVRHVPHDLVGPSAARNLGARESSGEILVFVDDDVYVEPQAVVRLAAAVEATHDSVVVGGTVAMEPWAPDGGWSLLMVTRPNGFCRPVRPGERPTFVISALIAHRRSLVIDVPWDEAQRYYDDRLQCLRWLIAGARLELEPRARAVHDDVRKPYPLAQERDRIYANLVLALVLEDDPRAALGFETLGLAHSVKRVVRNRAQLGELLSGWAGAHRRFLADRPALEALRGRARR